ncbi:MAG TPA: hypothetical protein VK961_04090 [Chthoniobacter sp.]|nr:hypothetical protein [Chthoniobacter sp.]
MKSVVLTVSIPATILSCQLNAPGEDIAEGPATDVPELKELNHYAGQWEEEIAGRPGVRRTEFSEWILQGRFLRQTWSTESKDGTPAAHGLTLMTYDVERKAYRSWAFLATGSVIENEGSWDAATNTFVWAHRITGTSETVVTKASFPNETTQAWSIVKTDEQNKVIREVAGQSSRRALSTLHPA